MSISPVNTTTSTFQPSTPTAATSSANSNSTLTMQSFITLLNTQLQNQDPMQPMDDSQFIAQTAQITTLQQAQTLTSDTEAMAATQAKGTAASYLGYLGTVTDSSGNTVSGQITGVDTSGTTPRLQINNQYYDLSSLQSLSYPTTPTTSTGSN